MRDNEKRDNENMEQEGVVTEEKKAERIHAIVYSCDSREELAERIVALEELVRVMACVEFDDHCGDCDRCLTNSAEMHVKFDKQIGCDGVYGMLRELGIEVTDE